MVSTSCILNRVYNGIVVIAAGGYLAWQPFVDLAIRPLGMAHPRHRFASCELELPVE